MEKVLFHREAISALDKNPWGETETDSVADCGFRQGTAPRIGTVWKEKTESDRRNLEKTMEDLEEAVSGNSMMVNFTDLSSKK